MRYGIGALSRDTGCNIETIRYYERIGILPEPPRSPGGHRSYSPDHTKTLAFIKRSREMGFSLDEIRQLIAMAGQSMSCDDVQSLTLKHIDSIRRRIADLQNLVSVLQTAADQCEGKEAPACPIIDALFDRTQSA
jgi:MerR family mercuric resistance operon transcriptional regulator